MVSRDEKRMKDLALRNTSEGDRVGFIIEANRRAKANAQKKLAGESECEKVSMKAVVEKELEVKKWVTDGRMKGVILSITGNGRRVTVKTILGDEKVYSSTALKKIPRPK